MCEWQHAGSGLTGGEQPLLLRQEQHLLLPYYQCYLQIAAIIYARWDSIQFASSCLTETWTKPNIQEVKNTKKIQKNEAHFLPQKGGKTSTNPHIKRVRLTCTECVYETAPWRRNTLEYIHCLVTVSTEVMLGKWRSREETICTPR